MNELDNIVSMMLSTLHEQLNLSESTFNLWFGDLKILELTDKHATLQTPTLVRQNILSTKYYETLKKTLGDIIGFTVDLKFVVAKEEPQEPAEEPEQFVFNTKKAAEEERRVERELKASTKKKKSLLDDYTFDNFIEGDSNKFARAACFAVANEPTTYNPLFIYSQPGLGKTHLLYAVMNYIKKNNPKTKIVYKKSETFINELISSISTGRTAEFKNKYRTADVLLIDDIQFLAGKEATQEEFFHTFSALYESDKQIILTSDRPPKEIKPLEERLRSRFEWGLIAEISAPSLELRSAIIAKKVKNLNLNMTPDLIEYMAERLHGNIRQIEGVLKKLDAMVSFTGSKITKDIIEQSILAIDPGNIPTEALVERILSTISKYYGVSVEDIKSRKKTGPISNARHTAIYLLKEKTDLTLQSIGDIFGRNHSTVLSSLNKMDIDIKTKKSTERDIKALTKELKLN